MIPITFGQKIHLVRFLSTPYYGFRFCTFFWWLRSRLHLHVAGASLAEQNNELLQHGLWAPPNSGATFPGVAAVAWQESLFQESSAFVGQSQRNIESTACLLQNSAKRGSGWSRETCKVRLESVSPGRKAWSRDLVASCF